jgi:hydrogenase maturation protein HypF
MELKRIQLPIKVKKPILALGSQNKNTVCFADGNYAYLSKIHQDLSNPKDFCDFGKIVKYFLKKSPKIIAYDLHPEYQSTKYVQEIPRVPKLIKLGIQHHHAHIASCMLENNLKNQKVIGVAFDGTGLGTDDKLWGAEFLVCDYKNFERSAHLQEIPLLGQEMAILEPWRLSAIWLYRIYRDRFLKLNIGFVKGLNQKKWRALKNIYLSGFNYALASSMGRLFDAVASLVLEKYKANFEAGLATELEKIASGYRLQASGYPFKIIRNQEGYILDPAPLFRQIVLDLRTKVSKEKIAYRFHLTVSQMIRKMCLILGKENKINKVVLSGGVFQNNLLLQLCPQFLYKEGFKVFLQREIFCNDSGISLGQVAIAAFSRQAI